MSSRLAAKRIHELLSLDSQRSRGRFLITLEGSDSVIQAYTKGDTTLAGKLMFPLVEPGTGMASIIKRDDPIANADIISRLLAKNYMVRTYADENQIGVSSLSGIVF